VLPLWTVGTRAAPAEPRRPPESRLLFPNIGYRQQLPMVVWSMLFSSLNSNLDTIHRTRIWTEGGPEQVDVAESERTRFRNPETGLTYIARRYGPDSVDGETIDSGIASRMIAHANELLVDTYQVRVDDRNQPVYNPDCSVDAVVVRGQLVPANADNQRQTIAVTRYRNYVGLIDATRNISRILGYGMIR
jgi:hypothetical protein